MTEQGWRVSKPDISASNKRRNVGNENMISSVYRRRNYAFDLLVLRKTIFINEDLVALSSRKLRIGLHEVDVDTILNKDLLYGG